MIQKVYVKNIEELAFEVKGPGPIFFIGASTSTVIPYDSDNLESKIGASKVVDLSGVEKNIEYFNQGEDSFLRVSGGVSWLDLKKFCEEHNLLMLTSPTEENALVLSGLATSATGERCFGFGTLRDQVYSLAYLNSRGERKLLSSKKKLIDTMPSYSLKTLKNYQDDFERSYLGFKNGAYPRMKNETDLLIGTEGQLGVIIEADIAVKARKESTFVFIELPKWEINDLLHLKISDWAQTQRSRSMVCELIDSNSLSVLPESEKPIESIDSDLVFFEVEESLVEDFYSELISSIPKLNKDKIFMMDQAKCHQLRMAIPRYTFERNSQMGVQKKGTDVQVTSNSFKELLSLYRDFSNKGISYNLFGHFGDCHLHFNFFPKPSEQELCDKLLEGLYSEIKTLGGSPFAEHGVGLFKKRFIRQFYGNSQLEMFSLLKKEFDPENKFFPGGFMNIGMGTG
jgi:FAD/FMN-containing dehydrogenase